MVVLLGAVLVLLRNLLVEAGEAFFEATLGDVRLLTVGSVVDLGLDLESAMEELSQVGTREQAEIQDEKYTPVEQKIPFCTSPTEREYHFLVSSHRPPPVPQPCPDYLHPLLE